MRRRVFSVPGAPDEFRLTLRGQELITGEDTFTITTAAGKVNFREVPAAADLDAAMVDEMKTPPATRAGRQAFIPGRMDGFLLIRTGSLPFRARTLTSRVNPTGLPGTTCGSAPLP